MKLSLPNRQQKTLASALAVPMGAAALLVSAFTLQAIAQDTELSGADDKSRSSQVVIIDGDEGVRRMVLVDNPFDEVSFDISKLEALSELDFGDLDLQLEGLELGIEGLNIAADAVHILDGFDGGALSAEIGKFAIALQAELDGGRFDEDRIEALAEDFEERVEAWAEDFEARFEAQSEDWEAKIEAHAEKWSEDFEERIEAWAEQFEAKAEEIELHAEGFEVHAERIELAGEVIEDLADECEDQRGVKVVTIRQEDDDIERTYKAICLDEGQGFADVAAILDEVRNEAILTEAELAKVEEALERADKDSDETRIEIRRSTKTKN